MRNQLFTVLLTLEEVQKLELIVGRDGITKADAMRRSLELDETIQELENKIEELELQIYNLQNEIEELQEEKEDYNENELYDEWRMDQL